MMLSQNSKMKKASLKTYNFDIPAIKCCPFAKDCKSYCYATKGFYQMPSVKRKFENNFLETKKDTFINLMNSEIDLLRSKNKIDALRIHSSGDFYSKNYLNQWINIIKNNPYIVFYAYTKSVPYFIGLELPENFKVIFSKGGTHDHLIDEMNLRNVSLVDSYDDRLTSDQDDSMIVFSNENIQIKRRW